jgi:hypothetical protein
MHDLQNMQNMLLLSSTSRALGRSALQCCGGHVRTVTLNLFSSGNAQHAVQRNTRLRLCWSYATMCQTTFHNLRILCQWPVRQFSSSRTYAMNASQYSIRKQHESEQKIDKNYFNT